MIDVFNAGLMWMVSILSVVMASVRTHQRAAFLAWVAASAAAAGLAIDEVFEYHERTVRVVGDEGALRRVVMNLLENGVKYNREGGEVRLSVWSEGGTARIEVADDGPGIPADHVPHLFERFHRVRANRVPGTGLGLSICRMLVEAHGGRIEVSSREGVGTSFRVELPARPAPAPAEIVR